MPSSSEIDVLSRQRIETQNVPVGLEVDAQGVTGDDVVRRIYKEEIVSSRMEVGVFPNVTKVT